MLEDAKTSSANRFHVRLRLGSPNNDYRATNCRHNANAQQKRQARTKAFEAWEAVTDNPMLDRLAA